MILLSDGFMDGIDTIQDIFTVIILGIIIFAAIMVWIGFSLRETWYRVILGILCLGFLVVCYFCFRHEMRHYIQGSLLLIISAVGFFKVFSK